MAYNEADTIAKLVTPNPYKRGWTERLGVQRLLAGLGGFNVLRHRKPYIVNLNHCLRVSRIKP